MRKVLLTTTALVALGGVSTASAIEVSGGYSFDYRDTSNTGVSADAANVSGNTMGSDGNIDFSGSVTTDAGLTFGGMIRIETNNTTGRTAAIEDQGAYISGDFGYIMMGQTDGIVDGMDNFMTSGNVQEVGNTTTRATAVGLNSSSNVTDNEATGKIGYRSPVVSGFQVGVSHEDAGSAATANNDLTSWIVTYDLGVAKLGYAQAKIKNASNTGADVTQTHYGASTSMAGIGLNVGFGTDKTAGAAGAADTSKIDTVDFELTYDVSDAASLYITTVKSEEKTGTNAGDKLDGQSYGLSYSIAPGASLLLEYTSSDYEDATVNTNGDGRTTTAVSLNVSF